MVKGHGNRKFIIQLGYNILMIKQVFTEVQNNRFLHQAFIAQH